ncbi:membrane protein, GtrA family [Clostridia bacterium]|nr:membrane protein, GtrA family [Clostridia bacterium]
MFIKLPEKSASKTRELAAYIAVGAATTLVNLLIFYLLYDTIRLETNLSNVISIVSAILFAYVCNKKFVFRSRAKNLSALLREAFSFFSSRAFTMLLEVGGVFLFCAVWLLDPLAVKLFVTAAVIALNYIFAKFLVFNKGN